MYIKQCLNNLPIDGHLFLQDARFSPEVDEVAGSRPKSILCLPVYNPREEVWFKFNKPNPHIGLLSHFTLVCFGGDNRTILTAISPI